MNSRAAERRLGISKVTASSQTDWLCVAGRGRTATYHPVQKLTATGTAIHVVLEEEMR
jgi:hypothetical protein